MNDNNYYLHFRLIVSRRRTLLITSFHRGQGIDAGKRDKTRRWQQLKHRSCQQVKSEFLGNTQLNITSNAGY